MLTILHQRQHYSLLCLTGSLSGRGQKKKSHSDSQPLERVSHYAVIGQLKTVKLDLMMRIAVLISIETNYQNGLSRALMDPLA